MSIKANSHCFSQRPAFEDIYQWLVKLEIHLKDGTPMPSDLDIDPFSSSFNQLLDNSRHLKSNSNTLEEEDCSNATNRGNTL